LSYRTVTVFGPSNKESERTARVGAMRSGKCHGLRGSNGRSSLIGPSPGHHAESLSLSIFGLDADRDVAIGSHLAGRP
jgi:hypothetical protein